MQTITYRSNWLNIASLLLLFPAIYFIATSVLKYGLGINAPYDLSSPILESSGISGPLSWNINLLILFGPLFSLLFSLLQVLQVDWHFSKEQFQFHIIISKKWLALSIAIISGMILIAMCIYFFGQNILNQHP